ncbi:MAG: DUF262 domain-containing protein [Enhygromyxa sp.]
MSTPSYLGEPRLVRLGKFLQEIKDGELYVPRFQRPFVWTTEQRLELLQSIYLGYPIGSVMVWRTQKYRLKTHDQLGPIRLPVRDDQDSSVQQYLLDGHQRMTTLFATLGPGLYEQESLEAAWLEDQRSEWPVYFDLDAEDTPSTNPFVLYRRRRGEEEVPLHLLNLNLLLDSFALGEYKDKLREMGATRARVNRVQAIADTLRDYTIPVVPMATEDLIQVTTSFKRVNSGGTPMSEVHMVNALTWSEEFDLLERLDDLARSLEAEGWGAFEPQMIMNVCKARFGFDIYKSSAETIADEINANPDALEQIRGAISRAARVLAEIGVCGPAALPYSYQAVLLADALQTAPDPNPAVMAQIKKWFWLTTLTEYFQSMTGSLFRRAQQHLAELIAGGADARPPDLRDTIDPLYRFDFKSARSRAIALLLAEQQPITPADRSRDPQLVLAQHGNGALTRLIEYKELPHQQRKLAAGPENRFLVPPREGARLRAALTAPDSDQAIELAATHAIPLDALEALRGGDVCTFLLKRRQALWGLERARCEEVGLDYREPEAEHT